MSEIADDFFDLEIGSLGSKPLPETPTPHAGPSPLPDLLSSSAEEILEQARPPRPQPTAESEMIGALTFTERTSTFLGLVAALRNEPGSATKLLEYYEGDPIGCDGVCFIATSKLPPNVLEATLTHVTPDVKAAFEAWQEEQKQAQQEAQAALSKPPTPPSPKPSGLKKLLSILRRRK